MSHCFLCMFSTLLWFYSVDFSIFLCICRAHPLIPVNCFSDRQVGDQRSQSEQDSCAQTFELCTEENVCQYLLILVIGPGLVRII